MKAKVLFSVLLIAFTALSVKAAIINDDILPSDVDRHGQTQGILLTDNQDNNTHQPDFLSQEERAWLNEHPKLQIGSSRNNYPLSYIDNEGRQAGLHVELIQLINDNLEADFSIKHYPIWSQAFAAMKEESVAGIFSLSHSKKRTQYIDYSPPYYYVHFETITQNTRNDIQQFSDLNHRRIAVFKGNIIDQMAKDKLSLVNYSYINSNSQGYEKVVNGEVDALLIPAVSPKKLKKHHLKVVGMVYNKAGEYSIGTLKKDPMLGRIMTKGIHSISSEQMNLLHQKYNEQHPEHSIFTDSELRYIREHPIVKLGLEEWPPIIFSGPNHRLKGIVGDYLQEIAKISSLSFEVIKGDWVDLLNKLKQKKIDFIPDAYYTKERTEYTLFSDAYFELASSLAVNKNNEITSFDDLNNKKIALVDGYSMVDVIKRQYPHIKIVLTANVSEALLLLSRGEVDATFGVDIILMHAINNSLIQNVKFINQTKYSTESLHFMSRKDRPLLRSILNKSLFSIPQAKKNEIIKKWTVETELKKVIDIAFGIGREPYSIDHKKQLQGIEFDLLRRAFESVDVQIRSTHKLQLEDLNTVLSEYPSLDAVITLERSNNQYYYSDYLIEFDNVAITRSSDNLKITNVSDLEGKSITAFEGSSRLLGSEYQRLFNPKDRPSDYSEVVFKHQNFTNLVNGVVDVLVIDRNIFKWHAKNANYHSFSSFTFHKIFSQPSRLYVAFRDEKLRDILNAELRKFRLNGEYQYIIDDYTQGFIAKKIEFNTIISSITADLMANYQLVELKRVLNDVADLPYIHDIKFYDINGQLIHRTSSSDRRFYNQENSIDILSNTPIKEGVLKVYFNDLMVDKQLVNLLLIPELSFFKGYSNYNYVRALYRRLNILDQQLVFTSAEQEYLDSHPILSYSEIDWRPLSVIEPSGNSGMIFDYMSIVTEGTGIEFEFVEMTSWAEMLAAFKAKRIDFLPSISTSLKYNNLGSKTDEYMSFNFAITMDENAQYTDKIEDLYGQKVAVVKNTSAFHYVNKFKDRLTIIVVPTLKIALNLLGEGQVAAVIDHFAIMVYQLTNVYQDLKIVGLLDASYSHRMLVQSDNPILLSILNKVIDSISVEQHQIIRDRWIKLKISTALDYRLIYQLVGIFLTILMILILILRKRAIISREIAHTNQKLNVTVAALKEQKSVFETLFYDTADGLLLTVDQMFIDCNSAALKMLGYGAKTQLLNQSVVEISPKYQPDGALSMDKCQQIHQECLVNGSARFEWVHLDINNQELWLEIVLTRIVLNNQDVTHTVWRDINEKKQLEQQILHRNEALEASNNELENAISELKETQQHLVASEKMASLGGLVAGIAHEINTPVGIGLTAITHFLETTKTLENKYQAKKMSQRDFDQYLEQTVEAANIINRNLERTADLVRSFKLIAVDQSSDERRTFNVNTYISEILTSIHHITKKSRMKIIASCDAGLVINSYPGAFSQIISNLIINSSIHAYPNNELGEILITVREVKGAIHLVYRDDGVGISEDNIGKIFDPFFTTNREHGGSGLGLNIIYNIVTNQLKGKIECTSKQGRYTQFLIVFTSSEDNQ